MKLEIGTIAAAALSVSLLLSASPVLAGDKILMVSEKGEVAVVKAEKDFEELARAPLGERVYASPAVADGKVFIRGEKHLFCFGKK